MAARDMIDLVDSSSSDEEEEGNASPALLSESPSSRQFHHQNRKRGPAETLSVLSSPPSSPDEIMTKSKRAEKREALERARQWRDNRKRGRANRGPNNRKDVVNLTSPSSPAPSHRTGRGASSSAEESSPTPKKMSKEERQAARERARRWHDNRHTTNASCESSTEEEVVNLASPQPDSPPVMIVNVQRHDGHLDGTFTAAAAGGGRRETQQRQSFAAIARMRESSGRDLQHSRAARSFAAASSNARGSQRGETQQWSCPRCTLLNNDDLPFCGACDEVNPSHRTSNGSSASSRDYDVNIDGSFFLESERNQRNDRRGARDFQPGARTAAERSFHANGNGFMSTSAIGGPSIDEMLAREIMEQRGGNNGWGRPRGFGPTSFRGGLDHVSANDYLSRMLQSMPTAFRHAHGPGENLDNMSYERLLEVFGDGSENRGASSQAISSLPISRINDPSDLPEDKRQCSICLEDFSGDDERTSLPCLHGFHSGCVNRWLSTNGTCPVCKTSISEG